MSAACYLLAGGGTGGHLFPGVAVAQALRGIDPACQILFMTTERTIDRDVLARVGFERIPQPVAPFTLHPLRAPAFLLRWRRSVRLASRVLAERRPRAVLGLGGYAAGPPIVAAARARLRNAILNPDVIPGIANRYLSRRSDRVVIQFEASRARFPRPERCALLGCPIRAGFGDADAAAGRRRFGLDSNPNRPLVLVTGASLGARTINRAMQVVWPAFHRQRPTWQLLHLTGGPDEAETRAAYAAAKVPASVLAFTDEMAAALAAADVVVSRGGASTLAELTAAGRPAILLPYPYHRDRHQHANARELERSGAALMLDDQIEPGRNAGPLLAALERLANAEARARMAASARSAGRRDAALAVARWLVDGASEAGA